MFNSDGHFTDGRMLGPSSRVARVPRILTFIALVLFAGCDRQQPYWVSSGALGFSGGEYPDDGECETLACEQLEAITNNSYETFSGKLWIYTTPPAIRTPDEYANTLTTRAVPDRITRNNERLGPNLFRVTVKRIDSFVATQTRADYCWAAVIQSLLNFRGIKIDQTEIVRGVHGDDAGIKESSASLGEIVVALSDWRPASHGGHQLIESSPLSVKPFMMVSDVGWQAPVILGLQNDEGTSGHVYLLTSITYSHVKGDGPVFHEVTLWDPFPGSGGWKNLTGLELKQRLQFAVRVRVTNVDV